MMIYTTDKIINARYVFSYEVAPEYIPDKTGKYVYTVVYSLKAYSSGTKRAVTIKSFDTEEEALEALGKIRNAIKSGRDQISTAELVHQ